MADIELTIDSIRVSLHNYQRVVILKEKDADRYLPVWVGPAEADAIAVKLQDVSVPRPLTHDFICMIVDSMGGHVREAVISDLINDTFFSKIIIKTNNNEDIEIDCRPSDALAVAVRLDVPILTNEKILKIAGVTLDPETGEPIGQASGAAISSEAGSPESSRFEVFSESTQDILNQCESESKRLNHKAVGTGHILLALLKNQVPNILLGVLNNLNINVYKFQQDVESALVAQPYIEGDEIGLTPAVKEAIQIAIAEAKRLGSAQVLPEHVFLGLIRSDEGMASIQIKNAGIVPEVVYIELIKSFSQPYHQPQPPERPIN